MRGPVVRGQKLGPFHGRVGGVAFKPEPSCARPKPGGSKWCEARNWARSLGGEGAWHGLLAWHVKKGNEQVARNTLGWLDR